MIVMKKSEAIKEMEAMANERKAILHPSIPAHAIPRTTYSDASTNDLQTLYCGLPGHDRRMGRPDQTRKDSTLKSWDASFPAGIFIGVEVKQPGEALRGRSGEATAPHHPSRRPAHHRQGRRLSGRLRSDK